MFFFHLKIENMFLNRHVCILVYKRMEINLQSLLNITLLDLKKENHIYHFYNGK